MTDPAGITQRGAEQSAPRSRSGLSAAQSYRVAGLRARIVPKYVTQSPVFTFYGKPPGARRELEGGQVVAKLGTYDRPATRARSAIECSAEGSRWIGSTLPRIRRSLGAQLSAHHGRAATSTVACLTSASSRSDACHVGVVSLAVFRGPTVSAGEASCLTVE
jgi:hypothetical protein